MEDKTPARARLRWIVAVSVAAALAVAPSLAAQAPSAERTLRSGGVTRSYRLHVPSALGIAGAGANAGAAPLVIVLHGGGGSGRRIEEHTGMSRLADRAGFIAVYPNGVRGRWNDGRGGAGAPHDDVAFIHALVDSLRRELRIDPLRIYATGISNGAMFAHRLACDLPGMLAAIAPVAGAIPVGIAARCAASGPVSAIAFQGTRDRLVPFDGDASTAAGGGILSAHATLAHLARRAGCDAAPDVGPPLDRVRDGTLVQRFSARGCGSHAIELHAVIGGGHTWPGGPPVRSVRLGRTTREIDASTLIWEFFRDHPRRQ